MQQPKWKMRSLPLVVLRFQFDQRKRRPRYSATRRRPSIQGIVLVASFFLEVEMSLQILSPAAPGEDAFGGFTGGEFKVSQEVSLMETVGDEVMFSGIVGQSVALRHVLQLVEMV